MGERWKLIAGLCVLLLVGGGIFLSLEQVQKLELGPVVDQDGRAFENQPFEQVFTDTELTVYGEDDALRWLLRAETLKRSSSDSQLLLIGIRGEAYEGEELTMKLTAREGHVDSETGNIEFSGQIFLESLSDSTTLSADHLDWKAEDGTFQAAGDVEVIQDGIRMTGGYLTGDQSLDRITFDSDVWGRYEEDG